MGGNVLGQRASRPLESAPSRRHGHTTVPTATGKMPVAPVARQPKWGCGLKGFAFRLTTFSNSAYDFWEFGLRFLKFGLRLFEIRLATSRIRLTKFDATANP